MVPPDARSFSTSSSVNGSIGGESDKRSEADWRRITGAGETGSSVRADDGSNGLAIRVMVGPVLPELAKEAEERGRGECERGRRRFGVGLLRFVGASLVLSVEGGMNDGET